MSAFDWKSQVVVVTGASAGIGASLARELGKRGASVVLAARRADKLAQVAAESGPSTLTVQADVTKRADVERIASAAKERFGHVDVWVNNVGRGISRHVLDLTDDDVDAMIRDNVKSVLYGMQVIVPLFKERRRGHLVNVSSLLGRIPFAPIRSAYSAAKAAMGSLTETMRMDLSSGYPDIRVTCVFPGVVTTDFGLNALGGGPDSRSFPGGQSPEDVATIIADAIEQRRGGDVYTRPEADERVVGHIRSLAAAT
jgi:NADP-dependent 3-hydroxy acid dehydrogenase YdfG